MPNKQPPPVESSGAPAAGRRLPAVRQDVQGIYLPEPVRKRLIHRLRRVRGQIRAIERQIARGECADDLLIQIAAVRGALTQFAVKILENYLVHCAQTCMRADGSTDEEVLQRIARALALILKQSS